MTSVSREKQRKGIGIEKDVVREEETDSEEGRILLPPVLGVLSSLLLGNASN